MDENGVVTFENGGTTTAPFADRGDVDAEIEVVGGVATSGDIVANVTPSNGTVTFVVDSENFDEVIPVVFADTTTTGTGNNALNLDADDLPTEDFGIGGQKTWLPTEAATGEDADDAEVVYVDTANDLFVTLDDMGDTDPDNDVYRLYTYEAGDTFTYDRGTNTATLAQFETALSEGDIVDVDYSTTFVSDFDIVEDVPGTPVNVEAAAGDFDDDTTDGADDVQVTWDAPNPPDGLIAGYRVYVTEDNVTTTAPCDGAPVDVDGDTAAGPGYAFTDDTEIVLEDLEAATYCVSVVAVSETEMPGDASLPAFVVVQPGADEDAPIITNIQAVTDVGGGTEGDEANDVLDAGDQIRATFDDAMALAADATLTVEDADGTVAEITRGENATFLVSQDGQTLLITLTDDPLVVDFAEDLLVEYPATIEDVAGFADTDGNVLVLVDENGDPIEGQDLVIESAAAAAAEAAIADAETELTQALALIATAEAQDTVAAGNAAVAGANEAETAAAEALAAAQASDDDELIAQAEALVVDAGAAADDADAALAAAQAIATAETTLDTNAAEIDTANVGLTTTLADEIVQDANALSDALTAAGITTTELDAAITALDNATAEQLSTEDGADALLNPVLTAADTATP